MADSAKINKVSMPWHEALADFFIANPGATGAQAARAFGRSASWISIVKHSDAFQDYYHSRRAEVNALMDAKLVDKLETVAELGVEGLMGKLEDHGSGEAPLGLDALREVTDMALSRLGFGQKKGESPLVDNSVNIYTNAQAVQVARKTMQEVREGVLDRELAKRAEEARDITPTEQDDNAGQVREADSPTLEVPTPE